MARYGTEHKQATRRRIIETAGRRLKRDGIDGSGVATLMADAGLTNGAFYAHFASKDDLVATAVADQLRDQRESLSAVAPGRAGVEQYVHAYLSAGHRDAAFAGARLVGLGQTSTPVIRTEIEKYATRNYVDDPGVNVTAFYTDNTNTHLGAITSAAGTVPANTTGVEVTTKQQAPTFFLPVIGFSNLQVSALAGARTKLTGAPPKPYNFFAKRST